MQRCACILACVAALFCVSCEMDEVRSKGTALPPGELPAFPGAEGFGATTPGGRGGKVIEVTTLSDDGPGSLREACYAEGPRIVVFRVGGIIDLKSDIKLSKPFLTIAGQTAPGDGICLRNATLRVCTHDVVIRYIRARVGDRPDGPKPENRDALKIEGTRVHHVVIDHCSMSWSIDENVSTWGTPHDVTIQWCIIAEALYKSLHPKGVHGMGLLIGDRSTRMTFHHNLLAHNPWRNPLMQGRGDETSDYDLRNNVIYDYGKFCTVIRGRIHINYVSNYLQSGPSTTVTQEIHLDVDRRNNGRPRIYLAGNTAPSCPDGKGDNWVMVKDMAGLGENVLRVKTAFSFPKVTTTSAAEARKSVLQSAGATLRRRDAVDARVVKDVKDGTGKAINSPRDVGGWPAYRSASPPPDSDHDGMPDAWEAKHGLNPRDPYDGPKDKDGDGYTNVEEFLNATSP